MKTIVLANNKGGVGKTTSVLNLADALVARGHTVLLIDGDQQGNLTQSFTYNPPTGRTLASVLLGRIELSEAVQEMRPGLYLLPSGNELNDAVAKRAEQPGAELALRKLLAPVQTDYVIVDTPGSMGKFTDMALTAAHGVLIPVHPEVYGIRGLVNLLGRCDMIVDGLNPSLKILGLFFTQYNRNDRRVVLRSNVEAIESHDVLGPFVLRSTIRDNVAVKEAQNQKQSLYEYAPESNAAIDYAVLTSELLERLENE
jgi:chromosome partitioning protein